jgi:hypothetical protein
MNGKSSITVEVVRHEIRWTSPGATPARYCLHAAPTAFSNQQARHEVEFTTRTSVGGRRRGYYRLRRRCPGRNAYCVFVPTRRPIVVIGKSVGTRGIGHLLDLAHEVIDISRVALIRILPFAS